MENTENLELNKPEYSDFADITKLNDNSDTLDGVIASLQVHLESVDDLDDPLGNDDALSPYLNGYDGTASNKPDSYGGMVMTIMLSDETSLSLQYAFSFSGQIFVRTKSATGTLGSWTDINEPSDTALTLVSGYTANVANVYKSGHIAVVKLGGVTPNETTSGWTKIASLPASATPKYQQYGTVCNDSDYTAATGAYSFQARVTTDGELQIYKPQNGKKIWGGFTYICA